jgi:hypothetical protein
LKDLVQRILVSGTAAGIASAAAAALFSRSENRHAARPLNAVAHIYDGGRPKAKDGPGGRNTAVGLGLHMAASLWWGTFFEGFFGPSARRGPAGAVAAASTIAAAAYVVDYHVVGKRFQPGFEKFLSSRAMLGVYAALAAGFVAAVQLGRLHDHEKENANESDKGRPAE